MLLHACIFFLSKETLHNNKCFFIEILRSYFFHVTYGMPYSYSDTISVTINSNIWVEYIMIGQRLKCVFSAVLYLLLTSLNNNNDPSVLGNKSGIMRF